MHGIAVATPNSPIPSQPSSARSESPSGGAQTITSASATGSDPASIHERRRPSPLRVRSEKKPIHGLARPSQTRDSPNKTPRAPGATPSTSAPNFT